jgi:hypothetical protein
MTRQPCSLHVRVEMAAKLAWHRCTITSVHMSSGEWWSRESELPDARERARPSLTKRSVLRNFLLWLQILMLTGWGDLGIVREEHIIYHVALYSCIMCVYRLILFFLVLCWVQRVSGSVIQVKTSAYFFFWHLRSHLPSGDFISSLHHIYFIGLLFDIWLVLPIMTSRLGNFGLDWFDDMLILATIWLATKFCLHLPFVLPKS